MNKNIADDYFSLTHNPRDGTMSPGTPGSGINPLHLTLSWGNTPDYSGLTRVKSHTGAISFKNTVVSKAQSDTKVYPYHTIHLTVPVPSKLQPTTPEDLLQNITGKCIECSNNRNKKCTHVQTADSLSNVSIKTPTGGRRDIKPKSILSKRGNQETIIDSHFSNSVSFDTVNLKYFDDLKNYPLSSFSDSGEDDDNDNDTGYIRDTNSLSLSPTKKKFSYGDRSRGRMKMEIPISSSARTSSRSPSRSLSPRARSPLNSDMVSEREDNMKNIFTLKYPTSPIITHDACTLTRTHKLFDNMYAGRLKNNLPKLHNRVIMCYISGRRHTWVGIDWAANRLLEDGDTLVIVASIKNPGRSLSRFQRRNSDIVAVANTVSENIVRNSPEYAQTVTENVMKYALSLINPERIVKITVELAIGSTKDVFHDMFELYQPSLVIIGAKPGRAAPTKSWATKRLSDRIVKTSPVPTIIISPMNMGLYESKLFKVLDKRMKFLNANNPNTFHQNDQLLNEMDNVGVYSLEDQSDYIKKSASNDPVILNEFDNFLKGRKVKTTKGKNVGSNSVDSDYDALDFADNENNDQSGDESDDSDISRDDSNDNNKIMNSDSDSVLEDASVDSNNPAPFVVNNDKSASFKLNRLELEAQIAIYKEVSKLESEPLTKDSFKQLLIVISDAAHTYGVKLAESAKLGGEESKLVRTLTGAPDQIDKRKSMVSEVVEKDDFDEKLKKFRQQKKLEQMQKGSNSKSKIPIKAPKINIESPPISRTGSFGLKTMKSADSSIQSATSSNSLSSVISNSATSEKKKKKGFFGMFRK